MLIQFHWILAWVLLFSCHLFPKMWSVNVTSIQENSNFCLWVTASSSLRKKTTAVQTRKSSSALACHHLISEFLLMLVAGHQNKEPFVVFRHSHTLPQHSSHLPQSVEPWLWFCLSRPLTKLWESKYRWTCADKITNYHNGCPNGCNKFQHETNSLRFYWLLMLLLPALVLLFDSSHILLSPKGLFGPSALINMLPWEEACFK